MPQTATGSGGAGSAPAESGDQYGQGGAASEDDSTIEEEEEVNPWSVVLPDGDIIDPPEDHPDPQVWHNHVKLLVKARFMPEHADHYSIKVQKDLEEVSRRRLPKFPRATALFGEFEPLPKDEVYALIVEQVARPRGWGMPCHHGDDQEPHLKIRPKGWSPSPIAVHNSGYQDTMCVAASARTGVSLDDRMQLAVLVGSRFVPGSASGALKIGGTAARTACGESSRTRAKRSGDSCRTRSGRRTPKRRKRCSTRRLRTDRSRRRKRELVRFAWLQGLSHLRADVIGLQPNRFRAQTTES